jgi:hypothetical protein
MPPHFDLKRDATGWTVFDRWTGRPVVIAQVLQAGLSFVDADDLVRKLNQNDDGDDRTVLQ